METGLNTTVTFFKLFVSDKQDLSSC